MQAGRKWDFFDCLFWKKNGNLREKKIYRSIVKYEREGERERNINRDRKFGQYFDSCERSFQTAFPFL